VPNAAENTFRLPNIRRGYWQRRILLNENIPALAATRKFENCDTAIRIPRRLKNTSLKKIFLSVTFAPRFTFALALYLLYVIKAIADEAISCRSRKHDAIARPVNLEIVGSDFDDDLTRKLNR